MTPTERLYFADPWAWEFRGRVIGHTAWGGAPAVMLDRSAFFPEGGGQLGDRGALGDARVLDVQVDDAGVVHHVIDGALPDLGNEVKGRVDGERRRVHMALHTGQHMLSRALLDAAGAATLSARLGEASCTVDVDLDPLPDAALAAALEQCNAAIDADLEIRAVFPEPAELARMELRRDPKVESEIRVVQIADYDASPCGGTHCTRTGQVGLVHIDNVERYKGGSRIGFSAGARARRQVCRHADLLRDIGRGLSTGPDEAPVAVARLRQALDHARGELRELRLAGAERTAEALLAAAGGARVVATLPGAQPEELRAIARRIVAERHRVCLLAAPGAEGTHVLVARGADADFDCGAFVARAATATNGRGGGRPDRAEGRLPGDLAWSALVAELAPET